MGNARRCKGSAAARSWRCGQRRPVRRRNGTALGRTAWQRPSRSYADSGGSRRAKGQCIGALELNTAANRADDERRSDARLPGSCRGSPAKSRSVESCAADAMVADLGLFLEASTCFYKFGFGERAPGCRRESERSRQPAGPDRTSPVARGAARRRTHDAGAP